MKTFMSIYPKKENGFVPVYLKRYGDKWRAASSETSSLSLAINIALAMNNSPVVAVGVVGFDGIVREKDEFSRMLNKVK